jgi:hypothetical protein
MWQQPEGAFWYMAGILVSTAGITLGTVIYACVMTDNNNTWTYDPEEDAARQEAEEKRREFRIKYKKVYASGGVAYFYEEKPPSEPKSKGGPGRDELGSSDIDE